MMFSMVATSYYCREYHIRLLNLRSKVNLEKIGAYLLLYKSVKIVKTVFHPDLRASDTK